MDEETNAGLRRKYLIFVAQLLGERDQLVTQFSRELAQVGGADLGPEQLELLNKMRGIDQILLQSRFSRTFAYATWVDYIISDVVGFARTRPLAFVMSIINFVATGIFVYLVAAGRIFSGLSKTVEMIFGMSKAEAASFDWSNPEHTKAVVIVGIALVLCLAFLFFSGAACLSRNAETRRRCWEFVKHTSTFLLGVVTGYFGYSA